MLVRRVRLFETPWTAALQAPQSMGFSRQEFWSGLPNPSPNVSLPSAYFYIGGHFSSESWRYSSVIPGFACLCWEIQHLDLLRNSAFGFVILFSLFPSFSLCPLHPETFPACWGKTYQPRAHLCKYLLSDAWMEGWMDRWMDAQVGSRLHGEWLLWPITSPAAAKRRKEWQSPAPGSKAGHSFFWLVTH